MVVEAAPAAALELCQADLLLEFAIILLDPVAALGMSDEVLERRVGRQRAQPEAPVLGSLGVLNDQPFLGIEMVPVPGRSDLNPARREPPASLSSRSFPPRDGAPVVRLPRAGQDIDPDGARLDLDELGAPGGGIRCGGRHDRGVAPDPERIAESEVPQRVAEAPGAAVSGIGQHDPARQAGGDGVADLIDRHLNPGAEREVGWHPGLQTAFAVVRPVLGQVEIAGDRHADGLGRQRQTDWQLAVVPTRPEYWMATPTECRPLLSKVVSSTIQCSMVPRFCIAGTTRPSTRSRTGPSFQLASLTKCWIDWCRRETFPLSRRSAIGSMLLRSPGSSSPVM